MSCVEEDGDICKRQDNCATYIVWKKINDAVNDVVDNITLADLVDLQVNNNK